MSNFDKSVAFFKEGKFIEALETINISIQEESTNSEYYFFRARIQTRLGNYESSLSDFDHLISLEPYNPTYISDRAVVLHLLKRDDEAMNEFDRAINLEPQNPYRYSSRAYFKDRIGDLNGAIEDYEKAIELDPEDAVAYNNKGLVEEKLGYQKRSKKSFEKADDLVGYKPKESQDNNLPPIGKNKEIESESRVTIEPMDPNEVPRKITLSGYLRTLRKVFTDKTTQKEFFSFVSNGFKKKEN